LDPKAIADGIERVWSEGMRVPPMEAEVKKYAPTEVGAQLKDIYGKLVRPTPSR